jgi:hypothetical protein
MVYSIVLHVMIVARAPIPADGHIPLYRAAGAGGIAVVEADVIV